MFTQQTAHELTRNRLTEGPPGMVARRQNHQIYDLLGVGFGPANLAVAVALDEPSGRGGRRGDVRFIEQQDGFAWQPGMLFSDARMQSCFLEDLATVRNPRSRFTFTNYLKEQGRLFQFMNLRDFYPTRNEFNDYLAWSSRQVSADVGYGQRVLAIDPVIDAGTVVQLRLTVEDLKTGALETCVARNLVMATGRIPFVPDGIARTSTTPIFHSSRFVAEIPNRFPDRSQALHFLIVGSGQSSADILNYLMQEYPNAEITVVFRQFSYRLMDDSCFLNELFHADLVSFIYDLPKEKRQIFDETYNRTNYSVVDEKLIATLYRRLYEERVLGCSRVTFMRFSELKLAREGTGGRVETEIRDLISEQTMQLSADALILATGYRRPPTHPLLSSLDRYLQRDEQGEYRVGRDYRIATSRDCLPSIFVQGWSDHTHGHGDAVLPILSSRASEIVVALDGLLSRDQDMEHDVHRVS
jgi:L-ornithine N5-monooxygenase